MSKRTAILGAQQADHGFAIAQLAVQRLAHGLRERYPVHFDDLMALVLARYAAQVARQVQVDGFREYPR